MRNWKLKDLLAKIVKLNPRNHALEQICVDLIPVDIDATVPAIADKLKQMGEQISLACNDMLDNLYNDLLKYADLIGELNRYKTNK